MRSSWQVPLNNMTSARATDAHVAIRSFHRVIEQSVVRLQLLQVERLPVPSDRASRRNNVAHQSRVPARVPVDDDQVAIVVAQIFAGRLAGFLFADALRIGFFRQSGDADIAADWRRAIFRQRRLCPSLPLQRPVNAKDGVRFLIVQRFHRTNHVRAQLPGDILRQ